MSRPADPVEFLALWLTKYCDNIESARVQKEIQQRYQAEEEAELVQVEVAKAAEEQEKSLQARDAAELESMNGIVSSEPDFTKLQDAILEFLKTKSGASAGYIGICEEIKELVAGGEGEEPAEVVKQAIQYKNATSNNKLMVGRQLVKDANEEVAKTQQGSLTLNMFEKVEDIPTPVEGEEPPAAPEGGWPMKWKDPYVSVKECVREPMMKYFRTPKLGGYLAVPFELSYEADSINEEEAEVVDGECPPYPTYTTTTKMERGMLGLDTLGTDREFLEAECSCAVEWTAKLGEGTARIYTEKITKERAERDAFKEKNVEQWADLAAARTLLAEELPALLEASKEAAAVARAEAMPAPAEGEEVVEGEEAPPVPEEGEEEIVARETCIKLEKLKERVTEKKEMVETLAGRTDAAPERATAHWKVLQAVLLFLKIAPDACDTWEKCKACVATEAFWTAFSACDVSKPREVLMVQSAESIKATLEPYTTKNMERSHIPISMLMEWLSAALEMQAAAVALRKAAKAKAEESGEDYTEAIEDTVTDKPAEVAPEAAAE